MDMEDWGEGPWLDEPDEVRFESHGYRCLLKRSIASGTWCGYVSVPESHPIYKCKDYYDDKISSLGVHGGITFFEHGQMNDEKFVLIGFDTAHMDDYSPILAKYYKNVCTVTGLGNLYNTLQRAYKPMQWVRAETVRLAQQIAFLHSIAREP